jgi:bla regulator protein BlaR1
MSLAGFWIESTQAALLNHLWQSTAVVGIAWLLSLALKTNHARTRYWVWMAASMKFLTPFLLLTTTGRWLRSLVAAPIAEKRALANVLEQIAQPFPQAQLFDTAKHSASAQHVDWLPSLLLAIWGCGAAIVLFRWAFGWARIRTAVRAASPLELAAEVPALSTPALLEPGVFGIFRPVLLMPAGISDRLSPEQLRTIVAHELCHVRRRDNLTIALHMVVQTLFWFHPAVWWIGERMIEERERACDEAVLEAGSEAGTYAEGILNVCKSYVELPLECVAGVSGADLKKRIVRIMTLHAQPLDFSRKLLLGAAGLAVVSAPIAVGLFHAAQVRAQDVHAQMPEWQMKAGGTMEFDVASVKHNKDDTPAPDTNFPLGRGDLYEPVGGLFRATDQPALVYIEFAYKVSGNQAMDLEKQLPNWVRTDRFDVEAHADGAPTKDQMRLMMQALLKDRFGFAMHYETREAPVLALEMAKPGKLGPNLRPHPANEACPNQFPVDDAGHMIQLALQALDGVRDVRFPSVCGGIVGMPPTTPRMIAAGGSNITMKLLADTMSSVPELGRPVVDKTGLTGMFDFRLEWAPPMTAPPPAGVNMPADDAGPSFIQALREQLGLRLGSDKAPVEQIVVDHIDWPTPN